MHHGVFSFFRYTFCAFLVWLVIFASATVQAQRFLYSFSGRVRSIDDPAGALATSNYYRTGDVVSASFIVDFSRSGYRILNDGSSLAVLWPIQPGPVGYFFYSRLVSGPLMPDLQSERASHPKAFRHELYGYDQAHYRTNIFDWVRSATLVGGSTASSFAIASRPAPGLESTIQRWSAGLEVVGVATAATDTEGPTAIMDMRLDSIVPAPNLHTPEPVASVRNAINIPGLIESSNDTYFILGGRGAYTRVSLSVSPSTDGDGDPLSFYWSGIGFGEVAHGEAPNVNLRPGAREIRSSASDGTLGGHDDLSLTIYSPAQATDVMRNAIRALPGSASAKTTALGLLQNARSSFLRADWRRGVQSLQAFEQFMARSSYSIPAAKRAPFINLSRAIRGAIARPLVVVDPPKNSEPPNWSGGVISWTVYPW